MKKTPHFTITLLGTNLNVVTDFLNCSFHIVILIPTGNPKKIK